MSDQQIREALNEHWAASDAGDFAIEHDIYLEDAVLDSAIPRANTRPTQHPDRPDRPAE
jgi:hypothetical protein